jgi:hypothetical protein
MSIKQILLCILALFGALLIGAAANMGILMIGPSIIPPPEGVNVTDVKSLRANIHLFEAKHYIMPFLAHALGTLVSAYVSVKIFILLKVDSIFAAISAVIIALLFLWGGLETSESINAPLTPMLVDAILCYFPMAILGYWLATMSGNKVVR